MRNYTQNPHSPEKSGEYQNQQATSDTETLSKASQKQELKSPKAISLQDPEHPFFYEFNVSCFQLTCDTKQLINIPLSPMLESEEQARKMCAELKQTIPTLKIINHVFLFLSEYERNRQAILGLIVPKSAGQRYKPAYLNNAIVIVRCLIADPKHKPTRESLDELQELLQKLSSLVTDNHPSSYQNAAKYMSMEAIK